MKRRLFTILSALSLLLCVAVVVLWVRSASRVDYVEHTAGSGTSYQLASGYGGLCLSASRSSGRTMPIHVHVLGEHSALTSGRLEGTLGSNRGYTVATYHFVPYKLLVVLLLVLPMIQLVGTVARRFEPVPGLCPSCGYDLRATPARCPECGAVAKGS